MKPWELPLRISICAGLLLLGACGQTAGVPAALSGEASAWIEKDFGYHARLKFRDLWLAHGEPGEKLVCGEFDAPPELPEKRLRFIYSGDGRYGQVEMHSGWAAGPLADKSILDENRRLFDGIWSRACEAFRPAWWRGRVAQ